MALSIQVTFDAVDPRSLGAFWCEALGYVEPPPPAPHASWEDALVAWGYTPDQFNDRYAIIDPDGRGPRIFLQKVAEPKRAKNRVHLDVNVGGDHSGRRERVRDHAQHLVSLGAHFEAEFDQERDFWIVMRDPEGNEFCVQ
jgi:hypothetical protein